jgi:hypothetical protein
VETCTFCGVFLASGLVFLDVKFDETCDSMYLIYILMSNWLVRLGLYHFCCFLLFFYGHVDIRRKATEEIQQVTIKCVVYSVD